MGENIPQYDPVKNRIDERENFERQMRALGNLNESEVREYGDFEFLMSGKESLNQQVRGYYLQLKSENPKAAESMLKEVGEILNPSLFSPHSQNVNIDETMEEPDINKLCAIFHKYLPRFIISCNGKIYH
jgi:hypothetical protein